MIRAWLRRRRDERAGTALAEMVAQAVAGIRADGAIADRLGRFDQAREHYGLEPPAEPAERAALLAWVRNGGDPPWLRQ